MNFYRCDLIILEVTNTTDTFTFACNETTVYDIIGTPSYPSTLEGYEESFNITVNYRRTYTDTACTETITTGTDTITIECGENPSTADSRVVSGTVDYHNNTIEYSVTQSSNGFKFKAIYSDSSINKVQCNGNSTLSSGETKPNGYVASAMTSAEIGDCVTVIGADAFRDCSGLTRLNSDTNGVFNIPSGVTSINDSGLRSCVLMKSVVIPNTVTNIGSTAFRYCIKLSSCTMSTNVTSIGEGAFSYCSGLTSIVIPDSVTSIGASAFNNCRGLTSITVNAIVPPTLGNNAFDSTNNCPIYVPSGSVEDYKAASGWSNYSTRIKAIP